MRKVLLFILNIAVIAGCQQQKEEKAPEGFTISGKIEGLAFPVLYFQYRAKDGDHKDTVQVTKGAFKMTGAVEEPQFAFLYADSGKFQKVFYIENVDMYIKGSMDSVEAIDVVGSSVQDDQEILEARVNANRSKAINYDNMAQKARNEGDSILAGKYDSLFMVYYKKEAGIRKQFILDYPNSFASLNELLNWTSEDSLDQAKEIYASISEALRNTSKGKEIAARIENLEKVKIGNPAIDFEQKDVDGNIVSLADYKGKYVLLEFWASWCGPCRAENPNLRAEYMKYKDKGFNILGVSLDNKEDRWKDAVKEDDLPWKQVSDLKGFKNEAATQYGIRAIPANFLLNPEGLIVAKNLRGEDLNDKLAELFN